MDKNVMWDRSPNKGVSALHVEVETTADDCECTASDHHPCAGLSIVEHLVSAEEFPCSPYDDEDDDQDTKYE